MPDKQNEEIGSMTGIAAGALVGASVGSAVMPIVGTFAGALAGGILGSEIGRTVGGAILEVFNPTETSAESNADVIAQLERLGQLRAQGLITEEEFTAAKAKILGL